MSRVFFEAEWWPSNDEDSVTVVAGVERVDSDEVSLNVNGTAGREHEGLLQLDCEAAEALGKALLHEARRIWGNS